MCPICLSILMRNILEIFGKKLTLFHKKPAWTLIIDSLGHIPYFQFTLQSDIHFTSIFSVCNLFSVGCSVSASHLWHCWTERGRTCAFKYLLHVSARNKLIAHAAFSVVWLLTLSAKRPAATLYLSKRGIIIAKLLACYIHGTM